MSSHTPTPPQEWPRGRRLDDARLEMWAIQERIKDLCRELAIALEHDDDWQIARITEAIYERAARTSRILLAVRHGDYSEVDKPEDEYDGLVT
jgi:hypothetical protein